jgi:hypothetical protein
VIILAEFENVAIDVRAEDIERVAKRPLIMYTGKPTSSTKGLSGQLYFDEAEEKLYLCIGKVSESSYTWVSINDLSDYVLNSLTIAGIDLKDNITAEDLRSAIKSQKVIKNNTVPPTTENENYAEIGDFYFQTLSLSPKLYLCISKTENPESIDGELDAYLYDWLDLTSNEIDLIGYVPATRKIAGLVLENDITVEQLQSALGIGDIETTLDSIIAIQENLIGGDTE